MVCLKIGAAYWLGHDHRYGKPESAKWRFASVRWGKKPEWRTCVASWRAETDPDLRESCRNKSSAENSFTVRAGGAFYGFRILGAHAATILSCHNRWPIWHGHQSIEYRCYCFVAFSVSKAMQKGSIENTNNNGAGNDNDFWYCRVVCPIYSSYKILSSFSTRFSRRLIYGFLNDYNFTQSSV